MLVAANACHRKVSDIAPGQLINQLMNGNFIHTLSAIETAVRRKVQTIGTVIPQPMLVKGIPHGNLGQKILIQAPVVDVGVANVKATDIIPNLFNTFVAPVFMNMPYNMPMNTRKATIQLVLS